MSSGIAVNIIFCMPRDLARQWRVLPGGEEILRGNNFISCCVLRNLLRFTALAIFFVGLRRLRTTQCPLLCEWNLIENSFVFVSFARSALFAGSQHLIRVPLEGFERTGWSSASLNASPYLRRYVSRCDRAQFRRK